MESLTKPQSHQYATWPFGAAPGARDKAWPAKITAICQRALKKGQAMSGNFSRHCPQ